MKHKQEPLVQFVQNPIDNKHKDCLWYGGRIVEIKYRGYTFILGAYGDVRAELLDREGNQLVYVKDKNNAGIFYEEMRHYIPDDEALNRTLEGEGRYLMILENNNWFEVLIDTPDGYQYDSGWVTNSDNLDEALDEVLDNLDSAIEEYEKGGETPNEQPET